MSDFLAMGGYAQFVWPAFIISLFVLIGMAVVTMRAYRRERAILNALEANEPSVSTRR